MAKRTIGKPRFYADLGQYLKAKGYYSGVSSGGISSGTGKEDLFTMNPYQQREFDITSTASQINFEFKIHPELDSPDNRQLAALLLEMNYVGVLGHNLKSLTDEDDDNIKNIFFRFRGEDGGSSVYANQVDPTEIVNYVPGGNEGVPEYNGYSLWGIAGVSNYGSFDMFSRARFEIKTQTDESGVSVDFGEDKKIKIGALTFGRYFEPSHSFDLKAKIKTSYSGIKVSTTPGGSTLTQTNYLKKNWGDLPAWTLEKQSGHDYNIGAERSTREWDVSLTYLSDEDVFSKAGNENKFFTWTDQEVSEDGTPEYVFDESMASFFKLTLNGGLPFIFCPNSSGSDPDNVDGEIDLEFAICRITKTPVFKQVANGVFSTSLTITEVM